MKRIAELVAAMTLQEKAELCSGLDFWHTKGNERLGLPSLMLTDGPHGLRKQVSKADHLGLNESAPATCFPSAAGLASTWNKELLREVGSALGKECRAENVSILLGPGANIKRSPLCGRNFEYFSEDPYLSSELSAAHIQGVQSEGVGTSLKHFAVNNQEHRRMSVDAIVDERTLREIYLASFEGAIKQQRPWSVMCAYNKVNGEFASESDYLLNKVLREEWGYEGFVVSDWGAVNERVAALKAGMELEMPANGEQGTAKIIAAVQSGELAEEVLDRAVSRLLRFILTAADVQQQEAVVVDREQHHLLARATAAEAVVMLKNEDSLLPLTTDAQVAVIGAFAKKPRYQGSGSSQVNPTRVDLAWDEMQKLAATPTLLSYAKGYHAESDTADEALIEEACQVASQAEAAVLFVGLPDHYESEGYDRTHLRIPASHIALIEAVAEVQPNIVVVLSNGAPIEMPWLGKTKAVLEGYLGGQASGSAIARILYGLDNPSGKLAESFPHRLSDTPAHLFYRGEGDRAEYREGIFVGYRYYDARELSTLFPFGFGLSYTTFAYRDMALSHQRITDQEQLQVTVTIENTGSVKGKEVVQLYVRDVESSVIRPVKELKGFSKVDLQPQQRETLTFVLDKRAFAYYNEELQDWVAESGEYEILVGASSQDIRLSTIVWVESSNNPAIKYDRNTLFGDLLKHPATAEKTKEVLHTSGLAQMFNSLDGEESEGMGATMLQYMPLRGLIHFTSGEYTEAQLTEFLKELNS